MTALRWGDGNTHALRKALAERDGRACFYCGDVPPLGFHVEHVTPRLRGGSDSLENLVLACRSCNKRKGSLPGWAFVIPGLVVKIHNARFQARIDRGEITLTTRSWYSREDLYPAFPGQSCPTRGVAR